MHDVRERQQLGWLGDVVVHPGIQASLARTTDHVRAAGDDRDAVVATGCFDLADMAGQFIAAHSRHVAVRQHERKPA